MSVTDDASPAASLPDTPEWPGVRREETLVASAVAVRRRLADAARAYDWEAVIDLLTADPSLVNVARLGSGSLYAPLHQAAHGGAPEEVVRRLLTLGAWRTLQNWRGERPVDVARRLGRESLLPLLEPVYRREVPGGVLLQIQSHFHAVIRERAAKLVEEHALRLPELEPLLEVDEPSMWFPVPGMYGGFSYWLEETGVNAKLIADSWCRVVGGSEQRHEITSAGSRRADAEGS